MTKILIYGDSNTWGYIKGGDRLPVEYRWPTILQQTLGREYKITQEGLPGRTAGSIDTEHPELDGKHRFEATLQRAGNVDIILIALGTNDLRTKYARKPKDIFQDLLWYRTFASKAQPHAQVIIIAPPAFKPKDNDDARNNNRLQLVREITERLGDGEYILPNKIAICAEDSVHFSKEGHRQMAKAVHAHLRICTN